MAARESKVWRGWRGLVASEQRAPLSGDNFHSGGVEPGAGTSLAKKAQFKGRPVHRGPQLSLLQSRRPALASLSEGVFSLYTQLSCAQLSGPVLGMGTAGLLVVSGADYLQGVPTA